MFRLFSFLDWERSLQEIHYLDLDQFLLLYQKVFHKFLFHNHLHPIEVSAQLSTKFNLEYHFRFECSKLIKIL